jgi:diaminopimelate decarboxylase
LAVLDAGAYGSVMSSMYNSHALAPEYMVKGGDFAKIRDRIGIETLMAAESLPPWA